MLTEEIPVTCRLGGEDVFRHIERLFGLGAAGALEGYIPLYCSGDFTEVYLLRQPLVEAVEVLFDAQRVPYTAGLYAGRLRSRKPYFIPSHVLLEKVYRYLGSYSRALQLTEVGVRAVLYGRDVLRESITSCYEPLEVGEVVSIIGNDGRVYAVGLSEIPGCCKLDEINKDEVIARTIFDLGWYLRGGTVPRESKYKLSRKTKT